MGMDVFGKNPKNKVGEYFRNNVWWWRPLWEYCIVNHSSLAFKVEDGFSNSGYGLNSSDSKKLAMYIQKDIDSGFALEYQNKREEFLNSLDDVDCSICEGKGIRFNNKKPFECSSCSGSGKTRPWIANYPFSVENLQEFQQFLDSCGGFKIC